MKRKKKKYVYVIAGLFALYIIAAYKTQIPYNPQLVEKQLVVNIK